MHYGSARRSLSLRPFFLQEMRIRISEGETDRVYREKFGVYSQCSRFIAVFSRMFMGFAGTIVPSEVRVRQHQVMETCDPEKKKV